MGQPDNKKLKNTNFPDAFAVKDSTFIIDNHEDILAWAKSSGESFLKSELANKSLTYQEKEQIVTVVTLLCDLSYREFLEKPGQWTPKTLIHICIEVIPFYVNSDETFLTALSSILTVYFLWCEKAYTLEQGKLLYQAMLNLTPDMFNAAIKAQQQSKKISTPIKQSQTSDSENTSWAEHFGEKIKDKLAFHSDSFPDVELFRLLEHPKMSKPLLHDLLNYAIVHHEDIDQSYVGHIHALFLLAELKDVSSFDIMIKLLALPGESLEILLGDLLAENMNQILASVYQDDFDALKELIENTHHYIWARNVGLQTLMVLVNTGRLDRGWLVQYLGELMDRRDFKNDPLLMGFVVNIACDLYPEELIDKIRLCYKHNLIDVHYIQLEEVEEVLKISKEEVLSMGLNKYRTVEDAIYSLRHTGLFEGQDDLNESDKAFDQVALKIGRNDMCFCGSGKKFKKCCLQ